MKYDLKFSNSHVVVVLDVDWDGSPCAEKITNDLTQQIRNSGWAENAFKVIVIDPELENWIWQQNIHVAKALGFDGQTSLMADIDLQLVWPQGKVKPSEPKEIMETLLEKNRIMRSSTLYQKITKHVSVTDCQDSAFQLLRNTLRTWFPSRTA
jgi:hypothetical protein